MYMQTVIILILTILANAFANVFIKLGTQKLPTLTAGNLVANLSKIFSNVWILLGVVLLATSFPLYNLLFQRLKLSIAFPLISSSAFAVAVIISVFVFHESLRAPQYVGLSLLIVALWLLAR